MNITNEIKSNIQWWIDNIGITFKLILRNPPQIQVFTDASNKGWGAFNKTSGAKTGDQWSSEEKQLHINI